MNVSLTPELEQYVNGKVQSGMYHTASEVIRDGLRLLKEKEDLHQHKLSELRKEIQIGIDQADRGHVSPFNEATLEDAKISGRERLKTNKASKAR